MDYLLTILTFKSKRKRSWIDYICPIGWEHSIWPCLDQVLVVHFVGEVLAMQMHMASTHMCANHASLWPWWLAHIYMPTMQVLAMLVDTHICANHTSLGHIGQYTHVCQSCKWPNICQLDNLSCQSYICVLRVSCALGILSVLKYLHIYKACFSHK